MARWMMVLGLVVLAACSSLDVTRDLPPKMQGDLQVTGVRVRTTPDADVPGDVLPRLQVGIQDALKNKPAGKAKVHLDVVVTSYRTTGFKVRTTLGMLAGPNGLAASVTVLDDNEVPIGTFDIVGRETPKAQGLTFYSQMQAVIEEASAKVVEALYGAPAD
ncbi:MAG: hypothetical protein ACM31L_15400 [Actinomycetota bacterium]